MGAMAVADQLTAVDWRREVAGLGMSLEDADPAECGEEYEIEQVRVDYGPEGAVVTLEGRRWAITWGYAERLENGRVSCEIVGYYPLGGERLTLRPGAEDWPVAGRMSLLGDSRPRTEGTYLADGGPLDYDWWDAAQDCVRLMTGADLVTLAHDYRLWVDGEEIGEVGEVG
jgi:hypothetical protein